MVIRRLITEAGDDMDYWFVSYKVRARNGDTLQGHQITETAAGVSPLVALEEATQKIADESQADLRSVRVLAFNRV
ncbi:MAG TPA: hypothetical protein DIT05_14635 [Morganella sp. (in: Bacteria)]|uniref:Uncharacterized protein n=2 Tax=Morganella psychrotolerans TaxID=368603 RepID=A0A1B8H579_9GAMM|nr:hypothetical protein AYY18_09830 [Morganella psychrotolerans]OBU07262.1 hypothetical protein AYY17_04360 [Morganella psychrotolerans]HCM63758.1 hypothetical protein [Morganella sp. (in: enterobacteria)]